jgi:outer membrane protein
MKKVLAIALCLFSLGAQAREDSGYDFFIGAAGWYTAANGSINAPSISYTLELEEDDIEKNYNSVLFAAFEHPVKFLPDILISRNNIRHDGTGTLTYIATFPVEGTVELTHSDITLYYNVLDGMGFLDLGATARIFTGELYLNILPSGPSSTSDLSTTLGLLYVKTGINMPLKGLSMGLSLNGGERANNHSADASLYISYETPEGLGATYGYRYFNTEIYSEGTLGPLSIDIGADFNVFGPFINLYYHF